MKSDVVIIGGGINGCALAYQLATRGVSVVLIEKNYLTYGATGRCGAGIRQQWSTRENVKLAMQSVKIFEKLQHELGWDIGLRQGGYIIAIHNEDALKQMERNVKMQQSLGLPVSLINTVGIKDIVPILDIEGMNAIGATFCPTDGHADPFKTTYSYAKAARENGAKISAFTEVIGIKKKNGKIRGVETSRGPIEADFVVNAAGAWSKQIAKMANVEVPNVPYRKEILVTERLQPLFDSMVISFQDGIYFSQLADGQVVGGIPIPDEKPGYRTAPTFAFLQHMSKTLTRYAPCLKFLKVVRQWTGFYDVTPDALPIVGAVEEVEGFIQCHGFSGHGFMIAPMITQLLTELIIDGKTSMSLERLELKRFEKKGLIKEKNVVG